MSIEKKTLIKKLSEVMKQVKYIEKRGFNKFHQYKYATESDVAEKVREVLAEQNVMMIPSIKEHSTREHINAKGKTEYIATVMMEFTFMDGDSGEAFTFCMSGEGQDAGDKAVYKAITGAQKYALMKAFMIPTGDDPESDDGVDERNDDRDRSNNSQPNDILRNLKTKWEVGNGTLDGFDDWYKKQKEQGFNEQQMIAYLTKRLQEKKKRGA